MTILHKSDEIASIQIILCSLIVCLFLYGLALTNYNLVHDVEYPYSTLVVAFFFAMFPAVALFLLTDVEK